MMKVSIGLACRVVREKLETNGIFSEEEFGEVKMVGATGFEPVTSCV